MQGENEAKSEGNINSETTTGKKTNNPESNIHLINTHSSTAQLRKEELQSTKDDISSLEKKIKTLEENSDSLADNLDAAKKRTQTT